MYKRPTFGYKHKKQGTVVLQDLTDWNGQTEGMDEVEIDWIDHVGRRDVTASITKFSADMELGESIRNHLAREWTENARQTGIEKIAFVSAGTESQQVDIGAPQEIRTFGSVDEAVGWASD